MRKSVVIVVDIVERTSSQAGSSGVPAVSQSEDNRVYARSIRTHTASMTIYRDVCGVNGEKETACMLKRRTRAMMSL